jgi:hypothetical protein
VKLSVDWGVGAPAPSSIPVSTNGIVCRTQIRSTSCADYRLFDRHWDLLARTDGFYPNCSRLSSVKSTRTDQIVCPLVPSTRTAKISDGLYETSMTVVYRNLSLYCVLES